MKKILDKARKNLTKKQKKQEKEKEPSPPEEEKEEKCEFQDNVYWKKNFSYPLEDLEAEFENF